MFSFDSLLVIVALALYELLGLAYYVHLRREEGPQGITGLVACLFAGGLTMLFVMAMTLLLVIVYAPIDWARKAL